MSAQGLNCDTPGWGGNQLGANYLEVAN